MKAGIRAFPVVQAARLLAHLHKSRRADRRCEACKQSACLATLHIALPELIAEECKLGMIARPGAARIFAVDNLGLCWMHRKAARREPRFQRKPNPQSEYWPISTRIFLIVTLGALLRPAAVILTKPAASIFASVRGRQLKLGVAASAGAGSPPRAIALICSSSEARF